MFASQFYRNSNQFICDKNYVAYAHSVSPKWAVSCQLNAKSTKVICIHMLHMDIA